jgi:hypothetical protein
MSAMNPIELIYPQLRSTNVWVDIDQPMSLAIKFELTHRGWMLRQESSGHQVLCIKDSDLSSFNMLLKQLLNDEFLRKKIPLSAPLRWDAFILRSK